MTTQPTYAPSGSRLATGVIVWLTSSFVVGIVTYAIALAVSPEWASNTDRMAMVITTEVYALLAASMLLIVGGGERNSTALAINPVGKAEILLGIGAVTAAFAVSAIGYALLDRISPTDPSVGEVLLGIGADGGRLEDAGVWATIVILFRVLVLVPIGEELLFRGALFGWLRRRLSPSWTILLTAVLFAVIHQFPIVLPLAFLWGVAAGWVRERTRSVVPTIVAHSLTLLVVVITSLIVSSWTARLPY